MHNDPYMTGKNENGRVYATLEYLLRNDKNVDKWLVQKLKPKLPDKPGEEWVEGIPDEYKSKTKKAEKTTDYYEDVYLT